MSSEPLPIDVGVLGATGAVGQQLVSRLDGHPFFRVAWLGASQRSEGRLYEELPWRLPRVMPEGVRNLAVERPEPGVAPRLLFSALDSSVAGPVEEAFARAGHIVVSNARNHRMDARVPLLIPEVNPDHLGLLSAQRRESGWRGAIVTNPNCSTVFLTMALAALRPFQPRVVSVTTLQAASGAGYPGVASLDIIGNVIPAIDGEEQKLESEPQKILGRLLDDSVEPDAVTISAQTTRVPVVDGHTELVAVGFDRRVPIDDVRRAFVEFSGLPQQLKLPSAPSRPIVYRDESDRPQPRLDAERDGGMVVHVGRLRSCPVLDVKFVVLGHNTVRGAAGAALLNAELMYAEGWLD